MKKSKLVGLATLFLALGGMAGCSDSENGENPVCEHKNVTQAHDETNHWDVCSDCGEKINVKKHVFKKDDAKTSENKAATCTEAGWTWQLCSCGETYKKEDKALGHNFTKVKSTTATCTEAGENTMECSRCGVEGTEKQAQEALGHDYVKAADQTGAITPGCEAGGTEKQKCSRCDSVRTVDIAANGHAFGEETSLETAGCATLKKAVCSKDQVERYSFDAKEVTDACKNEKRIVNEGAENQFVEPNYVEDGDGIKFWGRPIRNAMTLNENGDSSQNDHVSVFDATVTGSYFEYKINAPAAMTNLKLLAYMMPCSDLAATDDLYLGNTGDWTPGLDAEEHNYKFRYVITINGREVAWEDYSQAKYFKGDTDWYTFPLQGIALDQGENVIRISMAGGYRSTYYKFALQTQSNEEVHEHAYTNDPEHLSKAATCTEKGRRYGICSCGVAEDVELPALNHNWVADRQEGDYDATCTAAGSIHEKCDRNGCEETRVNTPAALGHDFQVYGEPIEHEGCAALQGYQCSRDGVMRYLINAKDVTDAAKVSTFSHKTVDDQGAEVDFIEPNYVEDGDGVKFWGRPINNKQNLTDAGANGDGAEPTDLNGIYDENVSGSFFEYKFYVPAKIEKVDLVANIKAADYMNGAGMFAGGNGDWTPGLKKDGETVSAYDTRYVFEIDGVEIEQDLTKDTPAPATSGGWGAPANTPAAWYKIPTKNALTFEEGVHTIRISMAGGYIATWYQLGIQTADPEPVTPPTPVHEHSWVEGATVAEEGKSAYRIDSCECGKDRIVISADKDVNGKITARGGKLPKGASNAYDGTAIAKYAFNLPAAIEGELKAKVNVDTADNCSEANGYSYYTGKNGGSSAIKVLPDNKTNTVMTVNSAAVTMPTTTYFEMGIEGTTEDKCGVADFGKFNFVEGANEFTLAGTDSYGLQYYEFYIEYDHVKANIKEWNYADVLAGNNGGSEQKADDKALLKLGSKGNSVTLNYEAAAAGKVTLKVLFSNKCSNLGNKLYGSNGDKFTVTVNGTQQAMPTDPNVIGMTMAQAGLKSDAGYGIGTGGDEYCVPVWVEFCDIDLVAGANTIVFTYSSGEGYSMCVQGFAIAK